MLRKDREVTRLEWIEEVLREAEWLTLAVRAADGTPHAVFLPFAYAADGILFCAAEEPGLSDLLAQNPRVCVQVVSRAEVIRHESIPAKFSMGYKSVTGFGRALSITEEQQAEEACRIMSDRFSAIIGFPVNVKQNLIKVEIEEVVGKSNGYRPEEC